MHLNVHRFVMISLILYASGASALIKIATTDHTVHHIFTDFYLQDYDHRVTSAQVYGSCGNESLCSFYLETNRPIDSPDHVISCQFHVTYPKDPTHPYKTADMQIVAIAKDKALLILSEGYVHNLFILHFSDCTAVPVKYGTDTSIRAIITTTFTVQSPYGSRFDVLLDVPGRNDTGGVMFRRLTIDFEGKVVGDVREWFLFPGMTGDTVLLHSPTKGRLVALFDDENRGGVSEKWIMKILAIDDNGSSHALKEQVVSNNSYMAMSATDELLTSCFGLNGFDSTRLTCVQIDPDGKMKFEISGLQLATEYTMERVYNLREGGFMLITVRCVEETEDGLCRYENKEALATRIDRTGSIFGSVKLANLKCNYYSAIHFFEDEAGHLCFSQVCPRDDTDDQVSLRMICSDDEDYGYEETTPKVIGSNKL